MTWKLLVGVLLFPYAIAVLLTAVMTLDNDVSGTDFAGFVDRAVNPEEITVDQPTIGTANPISTAISFVKTTTGWLGFLARAVALQGPIWEPWTAPIRFLILVLAGPALLMFTIQLAQALSFFIGGIFGRVAP